VIRSPGQFEGFGQYPNVGVKQAKNIQDVLDIGNDGTRPTRRQFYDHVSAASEVGGVAAFNA
jgi:hypothetical protein